MPDSGRPYVMFTDPELARVGLNETEARRRGIGYRLLTMPMEAVLRTHTLSEPRGFLKILIAADGDEILGFSAFGAEASEMMATVQTAMVGHVPYTALQSAIYAHPTMAEGITYLLRTQPASRLVSQRPARQAQPPHRNRRARQAGRRSSECSDPRQIALIFRRHQALEVTASLGRAVCRAAKQAPPAFALARSIRPTRSAIPLLGPAACSYPVCSTSRTAMTCACGTSRAMSSRRVP